jgi:predicted transcriptional regulator
MIHELRANKRRQIGRIVIAVAAILFGLATIKEGGSVVLGGEEACSKVRCVPFVVRFNFVAGFAYVAAGIGILVSHRSGLLLAKIIAGLTALVGLAFGVHAMTGGDYTVNTAAALSFRTGLWAAIAFGAARLITFPRLDTTIMTFLLLPLVGFSMPVRGEPGNVHDFVTIRLSDKYGGYIDGRAWSSDELRGKVHALFYVDPDAKNMNEHVAAAIREAGFDKSKYALIAVINMAATWLPNAAIEKMLKSHQGDYPDTIYVKDLNKTLVSRWGLADDSSNVLLFDKEGKALFQKNGRLSDAEVSTLLGLIRKNL